MKVRTLIAGMSAAAVVASGGLLFTTSANAQSAAPRSLKFESVEINAVEYATNTFAGSDDDYNAAGTLIGFDVLHFTTNPVSGKVRIAAAVVMDGGIIDGALTSASSTALITTGKVTGGTGAFRGATGTITVTAESATTSEVVVVFTN
jgi:hypothetical protein